MADRKDEVAIKVSNVSKSFKLPHEKHTSVKGALIGLFNSNRSYEKQQVLKDISFEIKKGDFFGIVGRNGSGKSTLLKLLAGIYTPDKGQIQINGNLTPFIELGVGFNPELTGRENVFLNGALLGFSRKEMEEMYDEIVDFAELEKFMDQKLKNYSSGMQVRLAFSIAVRANTDILVLDEVLAVGDYNFQQKCYEYFKKLKKMKKTVILVSHDSSALQMFCTKAVLIEKGEIKESGETTKVLKAYTEQNQEDQEKESLKRKPGNKTSETGNGKASLLGMTLKNNISKKATVFGPNENIYINMRLKFREYIKDPVIGLIIQDTEGGQPIFATNTLDGKMKTGSVSPGDIVNAVFTIENIFNDGKYYVSGAVASSDRSILFVRFMNAAEFQTIGWTVTAKARVYQDYEFKFIKEKKNENR